MEHYGVVGWKPLDEGIYMRKEFSNIKIRMVYWTAAGRDNLLPVSEFFHGIHLARATV
jgi:hypothetical protein